MSRRALTLAMGLVWLLAACDVEVSLGSQDGGTHDAHVMNMCSGHSDAGVCVACQADLCCDALIACEGAATCPCLVECVLSAHTIEECRVHCGGPDHDEHAPLIACARDHCATACAP